MQAIRPHDRVEPFASAVGQDRLDAVGALLDADDVNPELGSHVAAGIEGRLADGAARDRDEAAVPLLADLACIEMGDLLSATVHEAEPLLLGCLRAQVADDAHPLGHVVAEAPEVDDIALGSQSVRLLEQDGLVAVFAQPVCKRRSGDPDAIDADLHVVSPSIRSRIDPRSIGRSSGKASAITLRPPPARACAHMHRGAQARPHTAGRASFR